MSKYLPPTPPGVNYPIQNNAKETFQAEASNFLTHVAQRMAVEEVNDVGRIPSIMSRAYNFYLDLMPETVQEERAGRRHDAGAARLRARRAFRGIVTLLALRDALGLKVELRQFSPGSAGNEYRSVFADAYKESPEFGKAGKAGPGGATGDWAQLRYLVVGTPVGFEDGGKPVYRTDTLCGLSPFTLFFPAGKPMVNCKSVFWYNNDTGEWLDPTTDWTEHRDASSPSLIVNFQVIKAVRGHMIDWLQAVLNQSDTREEKRAAETLWAAFGLIDGRAAKLRQELSAWLGEMRAREYTTPPEAVRLEAAALSLVPPSGEAPVPLFKMEGNPTPVPLLEQKAVWGSGRATLAGMISELPRANGRVVLSNRLLRDQNIRVCGRLVGDPQLTAALQKLPAEGDGFVVHLGEKVFAITEPYLLVDKLFLPSLHFVADIPLTTNFSVMTPRNSKTGPYWLFPFQPEILPYLDVDSLQGANAEKVVRCTQIEVSGKEVLEVTVFVGGTAFSRNYDANEHVNRDMGGNALDLRIWPNFRFSTKPKLPVMDADRSHYFRIRQQPAWNLRTKILAAPARDAEGNMAREAASLRIFSARAWDPGWPEEMDAAAARLSQCFTFPARAVEGDDGPEAGEWVPRGVLFEDRGFLLFRLDEPRISAHANAVRKEVGVDFGTSNTCVAMSGGAEKSEADPQAVRFEVQTLTLHRKTVYEDFQDFVAQDLPTEGAAAVYDFPFKFTAEQFMYDADYFPTQLVTKLAGEPDGRSFLMSNGLIFARNLLGHKYFVYLLQGYPPVPPGNDRRPFRLARDPKWTNRTYRLPFLWHLYKTIIYNAARNGEEIGAARFSFPRAFDIDSINKFRSELSAVFTQHGGIPFELMTESDAVQRWLARREFNAHPLVLDIGGGTTDYLGLYSNQQFQASYELAAGMINKYFCASPAFQRAFKEAIGGVAPQPGRETERQNRRDQEVVLKELYDHTKSGNGLPEKYSEQAFFLMLNLVDQRIYPSIVSALQTRARNPQNPGESRAIAGFFHTLVLLYTGLVYQAGRIMQQHQIAVTNLDLRLIGNGSRFYHFLDHDNTNFSEVMQTMFQAAYQQTAVPDINLTSDPGGKTFVAQGLLCPARTRRAAVTRDTESFEYLMQMQADCPQPVTAEFADLRQFLQALHNKMPAGQLNGATVIPACGPNLVAELEGLFRPMITQVHEQEKKHARSLQKAWHEAEELAKTNEGAAAPVRDAALATAPRFIIRLKCLLDQVRESYAKSAD